MGTANLNFTYIDNDSNIDIVGDTSRFLDEIDYKLYTRTQQNVCIIGDSYTEGDYYKQKLNYIKPANMSIDYYGKSATGFVRELNYGDGTSFKRRVQEAIDSGKYYDTIIFYGGLNDCSSQATNSPYSATNPWGYIDPGEITNAIVELGTMIKNAATLRDARVIIVPNEKLYSGNHGNHLPYTFFYDGIKTGALKNGWEYIPSGRFWLWFMQNGYVEDGVHPSTDGGRTIARHMMEVILGGCPVIDYGEYRYLGMKTMGGFQGVLGVSYSFRDGDINVMFTLSNLSQPGPGRNLIIPKSMIPSQIVLPNYSIGGYVPYNQFCNVNAPTTAYIDLYDGVDELAVWGFRDGDIPSTQYDKVRVGFNIKI